jgi:propanol-preferring alcohol dehydrogenase
LIFGIGGLGHLALQYAVHFGATGTLNFLFLLRAHTPAVYACDFKPEARKLALELGATEAFDLIELTNKTTAGFTVDTTMDFVSNNQSNRLPLILNA